jgi:hypothetical protein
MILIRRVAVEGSEAGDALVPLLGTWPMSLSACSVS